MDLIMEQFELDMDILQSKYERVNEDLEFLIRKCDMKYIAESGTEDDLTALYTEANEQANEKKKNIFQKMIERIQAFIQKIVGKLKGYNDKIDDNGVYKVNDISKHLTEREKLNSELESAMSSKNPEKISAVNSKIKKLKIALGIGAGAALTTAVAIVSGKKIKQYNEKLDRIITKHQRRVDILKAAVNDSESLQDLDELTEAIQNLSFVDGELIKQANYWIPAKRAKIEKEIYDQEQKEQDDDYTDKIPNRT
jgi:hypothetical protein